MVSYVMAQMFLIQFDKSFKRLSAESILYKISNYLFKCLSFCCYVFIQKIKFKPNVFHRL